MKTPDTTQQIHSWCDGEMSERERAAFEAEMLQHPEWRDDAQSLERLGALLRTHVAIERAVPNADFFNSQIQERIAVLTRNEDRAKAASHNSSWITWFRSPFVIALGATAAIALGLFLSSNGDDITHTQILSHYTPNPNVEVESFHSNDAGATVILLEGLDAMPEDWEFSVMPAAEIQIADNTILVDRSII